MKKVSYCVPCFNEEMNIRKVYDQIKTVIASLPQYEHEIVFEDNASTDGTADILRELAAKDETVKVIINTRNFGPARSGKNCCFNASGDVILTLASDLQTPISMVPAFLAEWEHGFEVVMGIKERSYEGGVKRICRKIYYKIIQRCSEIPQYEQMTGFGAIDARVYEQIETMQDYDMSIRHLLAELGYDIKFIPYTQPEREAGKSSYNFWKSLDFSVSSLVNTSKAPIRIMTLLGFLGVVINVLAFVAIAVLGKIAQSEFGPYLGLITLVLFVGSSIVFCLGIIGEYVLRAIGLISKKPIVVERERINF